MNNKAYKHRLMTCGRIMISFLVFLTVLYDIFNILHEIVVLFRYWQF